MLTNIYCKGDIIVKKNFLYLLLVFIFIFSGCSKSQDVKSVETSAQTINETIEATSLKQNLLKEPIKQDITITLPPSYQSSKKKYPVVYFYHGFGDTNTALSTNSDELRKQMLQKGMKEFIIVEPNISNVLNGSFGVNSTTTGNWEDYITKDVINYVDEKYRTIRSADSRAISGFSMGGFVAINIGLKHPDLFSLVYALSPGLFDEQGLKDAMTTWDGSFLNAYAAAFSPNPKLETPFGNTPKFDNTSSDKKIVEEWENGFGNLKKKIQNYQSLNKPLTAINITYGDSDNYTWIINGCKYFSKIANEAGIKIELEVNPGCGHSIDPSFTSKKCVEFFSKYFPNT